MRRRLIAPVLILLALFAAAGWIDNPDDHQPINNSVLTLP